MTREGEERHRRGGRRVPCLIARHPLFEVGEGYVVELAALESKGKREGGAQGRGG